MQRLCKFGAAAMVLSLGTSLPMAAQDEVSADEPAEAPVKKAKKAVKQYPMVEISGVVKDAATGEPLPGVKLHAYNNSNYSAMTDENGAYTISVPTFVTAIATDYEDYNVAVTALNGRTSKVDITIHSSQFASDYASKTTAARSVSTSGNAHNTTVTPEQTIQNYLGSDVHTIQRSGIPGLGGTMFINGLNSLSSNAQPLIILDGVVFDMLYDQTENTLHNGYFNNLLDVVSPDDIESIQVLKNGTAIYGAKAANGVILINTKRSHSMATRIDVNIHGGVELRPNTMEVMNADQFRNYVSGLIQGTPATKTDFNFLTNDPAQKAYYNKYHNNTNWRDEVARAAWNQNYSIGIQGGDDVAAYNLSVGFADWKSTLKMNDMQRFNIRFNTDMKLNKWFTTKFDASYTNVTRDLRDDGLPINYGAEAIASPGFLAYAKAPFLSPYAYSLDGKLSSFYDDADTYLKDDDIIGGGKGSLANPRAILENGEAKNKNHSDNSMLNIAVAPTWQPTKNFSITEHFSYTMQSYDETYFTPIEGMPNYTVDGKGVVDHKKMSLYSKHNAIYSDTRVNWDILPNGPHRLNAFAGMRFTNDTYNASQIQGYNTGNDKTPNAGTHLLYKNIDGADVNWRSLSYYANFDYNYHEKYYLQAQLSMETNSRFGKEGDAGVKIGGVRWGLFPSVQAAWVLSNEKWFQAGKGVNMLKLNAGFESVGNDGLDNSAALTYMASGSLIGQSITSLGLANIGNSKLRWETTNRFNAGLEGNFLDNRLNVKFNYFYSRTNNLLALGALSYLTGLDSYMTNEGSLTNQGFDLAFNAKVVDAPKFKFEFGASVGHYKNKLRTLPDGRTEMDPVSAYNGYILSRVGSPVGTFYGWQTNGVIASSNDVDPNLINGKTGKAFQAGDMRFVDQNNDNVIDDKDRTIIGDPNPDIFGNIHANFFFGKRWNLAVNFNYSLGNDIYNYQRAMLESGSEFMNQTTAVTRRWFYEGQKTDMPRAYYGDPAGNARFSDRWIEDGSYLKLKNVTLSYKVPVQNQYIQGITVWAAANDLFTLTKYLGADPEVSCSGNVLFQGIDAGYLSIGRSFHLGVKINL